MKPEFMLYSSSHNLVSFHWTVDGEAIRTDEIGFRWRSEQEMDLYQHQNRRVFMRPIETAPKDGQVIILEDGAMRNL